MPAFEIFESFAVFCWCSFCVCEALLRVLKTFVFCAYFPLEKLRIMIKVHSSGQNLLFLCHEPMSTSLSSLNNTFKRLIICVCFWTTWVIWIWAANSYLIVYLPALLLKVQPSGGVPVLWEIMYWMPSFGEVWAFSLSLMHMIPWILRLKFIRFNKCLQGRSNFCFPLASMGFYIHLDFALIKSLYLLSLYFPLLDAFMGVFCILSFISVLNIRRVSPDTKLNVFRKDKSTLLWNGNLMLIFKSSLFFFLKNLFIHLLGAELLSNIVIVFAIHKYESVIDIYQNSSICTSTPTSLLTPFLLRLCQNTSFGVSCVLHQTGTGYLFYIW